MEWILDKNTYILRYHIPCDPTYDEKTFVRRGDELIDFCKTSKVCAVMFYVDLHPDWYYMPDSLSHTKYYAGLLRPLIKKLRENNISYQLNYQNLVGAWDGGADFTAVYGWENWVDERGRESKGVACCIGKKFREIAGEKLKIWAETKPDAIWLDDDIRFHNHRTAVRDVWTGKLAAEVTDFGCFCDAHMELFGRKYGCDISREELVDGILKGTPLREKWMEFSGGIADEFMQWASDTIHSVSPDTRVAVMTSLPDTHSVEGRNWNSFLKSLSGKHIPMLRPTFGPYAEDNPHRFLLAYTLLEQLKADITSQYGSKVDFCPEIENTRFSVWSKSIAGTSFQMMLSSFLGCRGVTLSIFDLDGCVPSEEPEFSKMLCDMKPVTDKLCEYDLWNRTSDGVCLITSPEGIKKSKRPVSEIIHLTQGRLWDDLIVKTGIPCKYITPEQISESKGILLDAYTAELLSDSEIQKLLAANVLMDAGAAKCLCDRGFGEFIGLEAGEKAGCMANCEVFEGVTHSDGSKIRIPARIDGNKCSRIILKGAEKLSTLITAEGSELPGFTRYVNSFGGIVYVYAGNGSVGDGFFSTHRIAFLKKICDEITGNSIVRVNNPSYAFVSSKSQGGRQAVMVTNMTADKITELKIICPKDISEADVIMQNGECIKPEILKNTVIIDNLCLHMYESIVCEILY